MSDENYYFIANNNYNERLVLCTGGIKIIKGETYFYTPYSEFNSLKEGILNI